MVFFTQVNQSVMEDSSTTKLIVTYNGCATQQGFSEYLKEKLPRSMREFTVTIVGQPSTDCTEFEVEFKSKNRARQAHSRIKKIDGLRSSFTNASIRSEIDNFKLSLQRKHGLLLVNNEDNVFLLEEKLRHLEILPKRCSLEQHEQIVQEQRMISQQKEEYLLQKKEFTDYCTELLTKLESIATSNQVDTKLLEEQFDKIKAKFGMECHRFSKPLPMYARRQQILTNITNHQVIILIGETGSGKSTQLVQYLHDAEILSDGIIVCTQPRKVAAVSLANFVSREMCVKVGEELGYKVGISGKCSENTKVLYMTDHALLNECINDQTFSKYSCVVIDEAHERSLHTDLLLSLVKSCLPHRKDLRVVITSATIDPVVFLKYFGNCPVILVPGRAYPVETIWKPVPTVGGLPTSDEIISAAIEMVETIQSTEEPGDVLVFLTSPAEVELACQLMNDKVDNESAIVLPLHGKLQPQDQQKVFHHYEGKRKVVFSTNVAETSVTIDGVKFVVDTGVAKELHFDPKRSMNTLEACWISKTSAEQRKGRAGRTCPGKCFRLYSAETHTAMRDRMLPELLRIQLSHAVLKLYEFGIKDVLQFDFVEQPDTLTLKEAVEMLKFVEAIDGRGLTAKGKTLATLPIDPQLGKVLLDGCEAGIGLEAAVAVVMSTAGGIFFRVGTDAEKEASDKKKLQFCHEGGDQLTNLCVYWKWSSQSKDSRNKWCYENSINAKSMRRVEETVKELQKILLTHNIRIATYFKDCKNAELFFPKLFFYAFLPNLAVFIGHDRAGYIVTETQIGSFFMFPGSVLVSQNFCPTVLVYEKTLKTSRQFLLQLMPVKQKWIEEAVSTGKLPLHPVERFKDYMVSAVSLPLVGWQVFKKGYIDDDLVKCQLKKTCQETPHSVDSSRAKVCGKIEIYSQCKYHNQVKTLLEQKFNLIRNEFMKEQHELGITADIDDVRLVLGNGGLIQHVLMPGECRTIVIKGPLNSEWTSNVMKQAKISGEIITTSSKAFKKEHRLYVTYSNPMNAATALIALAEQNEKLFVEPSKKYTCSQSATTLKVEWCRRQRKNFAFINFDHPLDAIRLLLFGHPIYRFKHDKDSLPSRPSGKIFATNIPTNHTVEDIEQAVKFVQMNDSTSPGEPFKVQLGYEKSFNTNHEKLCQLKHQLKALIEKFIGQKYCKVEMPSPKSHYYTYRAYIEVKDISDSDKLINGLREEMIDCHSLTVKPLLYSKVVILPKIYEAVKSEIKSVVATLQKVYGNNVSIEETKDHGKVVYQLKSEDTQAYITAKRILNNLTLPLVKDCRSDSLLRQFIMTSGCQQVMTSIESQTSTIISINKWSATVNVYGSNECKAEAIDLIEHHFETLLHGNIQSFDVLLKQPGRPPGLMKKVVAKFGLDLEQLTQRDGISGASLNVHKHILSVSATPEAYKCLQEEINAIHLAAGGSCVKSEVQFPDCCACYTEVDCEQNLFRLEFCGHVYCVECIKIQVTSPTATFPLVCAAEQCSQPFVVQDFTALCRRVNYSMQQLAEASLKNFVYANPDKIKNCLTPDCKMVYMISDEGTKFLCSLCGVTICTKCHVQYHDNLTCAMYQSAKSGDRDVLPWLKKDPQRRKCCPKCAVPIEKIGGCRHVACRCGAHICWVCLEHFGSSQSCYGHLTSSHGSA